MAHPSNHDQLDVMRIEEGVAIANQLFSGALEKGVIRRARLRCCLLPPAFDVAHVSKIYDDFVSSKLPLTT
jgi:hypothetical protein